MSLSVEVPDDVRNILEGRWGDLSRHLRENMALDGYRQGLLNLAQVRRLLEFATRWELCDWWIAGLMNLCYTVQLISVSSVPLRLGT